MANQTLRAATVRAAAKRAERAGRTPPSDGESLTTAPARKAPEPTVRAEKTEATGTSEGRKAVRRPGVLGAVLAVLVLLAVAATATLGLRYREAERTDGARTAALAAAQKAAPAILSYDHRHLDRDFAAARAHLTGPFLDEYGKTTSTVVAPTAKTYHGVVKATVAKPPAADADPAASVVSATADKVVVLLFMNQVTTSTQIATPRLDLNRVRMTLVRTPQGWKVSAVDAL